MSTIVVVKKAGVACIAADTLTTLGNTKESARYIEQPTKIVKVGESYIASVGHASWELVLRSYFSDRKRKRDFHSTLAIFETVREMHRFLKEKYYLNPEAEKDADFESSQLDALIANAHGIFGLYSLRSVQAYTRFYARGTGAHYALGAMFAAYDDNTKDAEAVARLGLAAAAEFDDVTALPLDLFTLRLKSE
ncbi:MAG: hypothetical protein HYY24_07940 [Verrucomicrobia bacterium]|nr:hypothetical protein [Verrucomicrobiota bacterium]